MAYGKAQLPQVLLDLLGIQGTQELARRWLGASTKFTAEEWTIRGSSDEDAWSRPVHHFFDPIYNRGLTFSGSPLGEKAYEWALEEPEEVSGQAYSYRHAKEAYLKALTYEDPQLREHWLATTFYTLGRVLHVLQDMASPAHTRNARHVGRSGILDLGPKSVVELHLDTIRGSLTYDGYSVPREAFVQPRDLWVEMDAGGRPLSGPAARGLSQVINRNFVSEGTNFTAFQHGSHAREYPLPILDTTRCEDEHVSTTDADGRPVVGPVTFCGNSFVDPITNTLETNPRMTTFSLFGRDLAERQTPLDGTFGLNALNAESIGRLTIPRAVGYSAALLDHFFRGKLDFQVYPTYYDTTQFVLGLWNYSSEPMTGSFSLYAEDREGRRQLVQGAVMQDVTIPAASTSENYFHNYRSIRFTPDPSFRLNGLTLVFTGTLGTEEGAVVAKVKPWEPGILPVQELAQITGPGHVVTDLPGSDEDGKLHDLIQGTATITFSMDPRIQQARGEFRASHGAIAGEFIKRIWLPVFSWNDNRGLSLRVNDVNVGFEWIRNGGPALTPTTWRIMFDSTMRVDDGSRRYGLPGFLHLETLNGTEWVIPLAWWREKVSIGRSRVEYLPGDCWTNTNILVYTSTGMISRVETLGVGPESYLPTGSYFGYPVGTWFQSGGIEHDWSKGCPQDMSSPFIGAHVFTGDSWDHRAMASYGQGNEAYVWMNYDVMSDAPTPVQPPPLPSAPISLRRDFSPVEAEKLRRYGLSPDEEYITTLR